MLLCLTRDKFFTGIVFSFLCHDKLDTCIPIELTREFMLREVKSLAKVMKLVWV